MKEERGGNRGRGQRKVVTARGYLLEQTRTGTRRSRVKGEPAEYVHYWVGNGSFSRGAYRRKPGFRGALLSGEEDTGYPFINRYLPVADVHAGEFTESEPSTGQGR